MPETAIILVNYNAPKDILEGCLNSLNKKEILEKNKIILVDNNSKNQKVIKSISKKYFFIDYIFNKENSGFGGGKQYRYKICS